jgi:hypothetical protein
LMRGPLVPADVLTLTRACQVAQVVYLTHW